MGKVLISGYCSLDRIIKVDRDLIIGKTSIVVNKNPGVIYYGGCSVNISCELSKLGLVATPILRVGDDYEKSGFREFLKKHNVDLSGITKVAKEATSCAFLIEHENGDHITLFSPGAMHHDNFIDYDEEIFKDAKTVIMTVNSLKDNLEVIRLAKKYQLDIILGMKLDKTGFTDEILYEVINQTKIIFANKEEAKDLKKLFGFKAIKEFFEFKNLDCIVVTDGEKGSVIYTKTKKYKIDIVNVKKVVDTTGAGDAYLSGFMYGYLNNKDYETCGKYGSTMASFIIEKMGCISNAPTIDKFIKRYNKVYGVKK